MNILFVLENYFPHIGGVEVLFKNLAEGLASRGHDVSIVTHKLKETKKYEFINGVKIYRVRCFHSRYLFTFFSIPKVLKLAKDADIVHATTFNAAFPAWLAARLRKKPCALSVMEVWIGKWKDIGGMSSISSKIHDILEKMIYILPFERYICISKSTQKQLLSAGINKKKTDLVYPSVDYDLFNPNKYDRGKIREKFNLKKNFVCMFFGRPGISKGLEYLIKAVPLISQKIPNSKLLAIVSRDKVYRRRYDYILKLIKDLKIEDKVILINSVPREDLPSYIKASDCMIVPSLAEGFGFTVAESCAMDVPVVASNVGSIPEVISGKYVLVEPRNPKTIAEGIERIHSGKIKKTKKKFFKKEDSIKKYIEIYKKLK